jgi:DNA-binding NarL/FixJ family response regulator
MQQSSVPQAHSLGEATDGTRPLAEVFLMQSHPLMILGTITFLNSLADVRVVGSSQTPEESFQTLASHRPNLIIFELAITGPYGFADLKKLRRLFPSLPVLVYSYHEEVIFARRALDSGAFGYVMKEAPPTDLAEAIRQVMAGKIFLSDRVKRRIERETLASSDGREIPFINGSVVNSLSNRELHVFQLLGEGCPPETIAERVGLVPQAFGNMLYRMKKKLGLATTAALIHCAFHWAYYEGDFS